MKTFLLTILMMLNAFNVFTQSIIHVPGDYSTIQAAIDASFNGDTILVQPGIYYERINFNGKAILIGSTYIFTQDTTAISNTIIDGNNLPNVVTFNSLEGINSKLIGFTIQNGFYNGGNSVYNGAGILIDGASPYVGHCTIRDNYISWYGGGICIKNGSTAFLNSLVVKDNYSQHHGGGIAILAAAPRLTNLVVYGNSTGERGGGIYIASTPQPTLINCTITSNYAVGYASHFGGGISTNGGSNMIVLNSIIWNNTPNQIDDEFSQIHPVFYSNIQGGYSGTGNINDNPKFVNSSIGNYRLTDYSPSIGAGIDSLLYSGTWYYSPGNDPDLNPRPNPVNSNPDQGVYENPLAHFSLLPPVLYSVANGSVNQPTTIPLNWYSVYAATNYRFQLSTDSTFQTILIDQQNITDTLFEVSSLNYLTTYYWRVNASYPYHTSAWSEVWSFETIIQAPEIPELFSPANNSFNLQTIQEFIWHPSLRAEVYHLQISTDSLFTTIVLEDSLIIDSTKTISGLNNNTQYYWRVRAINVGGYSSFSAFHTFRTLLQTPSLQSPTNSSINVSINPIFTWSQVLGAINYHIQISLNNSFTQIVQEDSLITNNSIQLGPLNNSTTYYWRVRGYNGDITSTFSLPFMFTTIISNPNFPILVSPLNGSINQPLNSTFVWEPVSSASSYRLQISADSAFSSFIFDDSTITGTSRLVNLPNSNQKYWWRVQAKNVGGYSPFSSFWYLITILPPPVISAAVPGNKIIELSWNQLPLGNLQRTNIYRDIIPNPAVLIDTVDYTDTSFIDTGLSNGVTYYYRIKSVSIYGVESDFSNQFSATPLNSPPIAVSLNDVFLPNEGKVLTKQLTFSSSGSYDPDGSIDSVKWYVNDELIVNGEDLIYDFIQGTHKVTLIVIDNDGERDTSSATVTRSMFRNMVNGQVVAGLSLIGDNILYAIVNGDAVYKMDKDGNIDYTLQVGGNLLASSSIANDSSVYIGSTDNNIYAFSKSGTSLWVRALGGAVTTTPTIDILNDRVYVGVSNRNFQFLDRASGNVLGNYFSDAPINTSAVITADNKLFFSTVKGTMYGFDLSSITFPNVSPTWTISSTDTISSSPAIDEEGFFYVGTKNGLLKKISMQTGLQGTVVWQANLGGEIIASPVIDATGNIYVGSSNYIFYCVDRLNGDIKWSYTFGGQIKTAAAISDQSRIYFGTENGYVYCVDTTGSNLWQYKDSTSICNSLLYSDGVLYLGTYGGRIVAIYDYEVTDFSVIANNIWSTFQGNNQRTGEQADRITNIEQDYSSLPSEYILYNNYPNPYNPSTTIKYGLPFNSKVKIEVFNIIGERVIELLNTEQSAGFYEVVFVAYDLASGVYIYKISAVSTDTKSSYQAIKKMILLK